MSPSSIPAAPSLSVGALQYCVLPGNIEENLRRIREALRPPEDRLDLLTLPEMALTGFDYPRLNNLSETVGPALEQLQEILGAYTRNIVLTVPARTETGICNRLLFIDIEAGILNHYDKIHRIGHGGFRETDFIAGGDRTVVHEYRGWRIGFSICYDLRFPELYRMMQPDLILLPAQWPSSRHNHLQILSRARAIENQAFILLCNINGSVGRMEFKGGSQVLDPLGELLADAGENTGLVEATLHRATLDEWRSTFPVLQDTVLMKGNRITSA